MPPLLLALYGCRAQVPEPSVTLYDALGLPDCAASYTGYDICTTIKPWRSTVPEGYDAEEWGNTPVRWIGTEAGYCAEGATDAEAWVLEQEPDPDGTHRLDTRDARWTDVLRYEEERLVERQRVVHCAFLAEQAATPPGLDAVASFARYAAPPVEDDDYFPVLREITKWRSVPLTYQTVISWGEVRTESLHLRTCNVRCGVCEDTTGGRFRSITGVLEQVDWLADPVTGEVSFTPTPILEVDCYASW